MQFSLFLTASLATLALLPGDDAPFDTWQERVKAVETLVADIEITSTSGKVANVHFAYEAPETCHLRTEIDGELAAEIWLDGSEATFHMLQEDGSVVYGELDWLQIGEAALGWLDELRAELPSGEPAKEPEPGPIFDVWPDFGEDKVDLSLSYHTNPVSLFGFLVRLERGGFDARELEDGWEVDLDGEGRMQLEPQLGFPRACWMNEADGERRAFTLLGLEIDGELAAEDLEPSARPDGAVDRSQELARSLEQSRWSEARDLGFQWLAARADEGADLEEESREVAVEALTALHATWAAEQLAARVEAENAAYDGWLDQVIEWYEANREEPEAKTKLAEALRGGREGVRQRLAKTAMSYREIQTTAPLTDPDPGTAELLLELEAEAILRAFYAGLVTPVMEHVDERIAELDQ